MREETAALVIQKVLVREGGIADVGDGKGVTRFGQTSDWLAEYGLPSPENAVQAAANYRAWLDTTRLIVLCDVADPLADYVIDFAVHSHARTSIRTLQRALGVTADGILGPQTESALAHADRRRLAFKFMAERMRFVGRLITNEPTMNAKYAHGWMNRLAEQVESLA